jgi:hypothetical protein
VRSERADFRLEDVLQQMPAAVVIVEAPTGRIVHVESHGPAAPTGRPSSP